MEKEEIKNNYLERVNQLMKQLEARRDELKQGLQYNLTYSREEDRKRIKERYEKEIDDIIYYITALDSLEGEIKYYTTIEEGKIIFERPVLFSIKEEEYNAYMEARDKGLTDEEIKAYEEKKSALEDKRTNATVIIRPIFNNERYNQRFSERERIDDDKTRYFNSEDEQEKLNKFKAELEFVKAVNEFDGSKKQFKVLKEMLETVESDNTRHYERFLDNYESSINKGKGLEELKRDVTIYFGIIYETMYKGGYDLPELPELTKKEYINNPKEKMRYETTKAELEKQGYEYEPILLPGDFEENYRRIDRQLIVMQGDIYRLKQAEKELERLKKEKIEYFDKEQAKIDEEFINLLQEKNISQDTIDFMMQQKKLPWSLGFVKREYICQLFRKDVEKGMPIIKNMLGFPILSEKEEKNLGEMLEDKENERIEPKPFSM